MENREMTAKEIFDELKNSKVTVTDKSLDEFEKNCIIQGEKFLAAKQKTALMRLVFLKNCISKERELVKLGFDKFIYQDDIEEFLTRREVRQSDIKFIELEEYPRVIPDEIVEAIKKTEHIFSHFYVLFTDYSGTVQKQAIKNQEIRRKEKDPILFGTFQQIPEGANPEHMTARELEAFMINSRFYVIGDWIDEYCDLTLDKFMQMTSPEVVKSIYTPKTLEEISAEMNRYNEELKIKREAHNIPVVNKKQGLFQKVRSWLNG